MHIGTTVIRRRTVLRGTLFGAALAFTPGTYRRVLAAPTRPGSSPYGPLGPAGADGVRVPAGFTARVVARAGEPVRSSGYRWPTYPDGAACFPLAGGGWHYVCNSEVDDGGGGVGAIEFARDGSIVGAHSVLTGTSRNCAGGPTPWGTWLSCEENGDAGQVHECQPDGSGARVLPALGSFNHEAVAVDPDGRAVYLTEDTADGRLYRFLPADYPDLAAGGRLQAAQLDSGGFVTWLDVDPASSPTPVRHQQPDATAFNRGEGMWFDQEGPGQPGFVYFTTTGDDTVWVLDIAMNRVTRLHDGRDVPDGEAVLTGADNVTVAPSGDVLVAEDGGNLEIVLIAADTREVAPLVRLEGPEHEGSEVTGPCFSPDGQRLYFSSQRGGGGGITYEVAGPFRTERIGVAARDVLDDPRATPTEPAEAATPTAPTQPTSPAGASTPTGAIVAGTAAVAAAVVGAAAVRGRRDRSDEPSGDHDPHG